MADVATITAAVDAYFGDAKARHLADTTLRKRRELLEGKLLTFCRAQGYSQLKQLTVTNLRAFRNGWPYSALSAVKRLERSRVTNGRLFLFTQKTGTPVYCPLRPEVVTALASVPNEHSDYLFWDAKSTRETTDKSWNRAFNSLFKTATPPIQGGHPHRFRDTFAVSLLLKGVSLESVSKLLGHTSIKVTERHYVP